MSPSCTGCGELSTVLASLGEKYKNNGDVVIATIDGAANKLEEIELSGYPTIILFPKNNKNGMDFDGDVTVEALARFIDSDGKDDGLLSKAAKADQSPENLNQQKRKGEETKKTSGMEEKKQEPVDNSGQSVSAFFRI